jgi:hypothetical protein
MEVEPFCFPDQLYCLMGANREQSINKTEKDSVLSTLIGWRLSKVKGEAQLDLRAMRIGL